MIKQLVRSPKAWLAAFVLLDVLHRCILLAAGPWPLWYWGDASLYWKLGGALASGEGMIAVDPEVVRTPGYPLFIAIFRGLFGEHGLQATIVAQNVMAVIASLLLARAGAVVTGRRWAAPLVYMVLLGCTGRVQYDQMILTESLSGALLSIHAVGLVLGCRDPQRRWWVLAGVTGAMLVVVRPAMVMLPFCEGVLVAVVLRPGWRPWLAAAVIAGTPACSVTAWLVRNRAVTGEWLLVGRTPEHAWEHTFQPHGAALPLPSWVGAGLPAGIDTRTGAAVRNALDAAGWSVPQRNAWMARAVDDAQRTYQGEHWSRVVAAIPGLWTSNRESVGLWVWNREIPHTAFAEQATWHWSRPAEFVRPILSFAYKFPVWLVSMFSASAVAASLLLFAWGSPTRPMGILVLFCMGYLGVVTALKMYPLYRFQVPAHGLLALVIGCALVGAWDRLACRFRRSVAP